MWFAVDTFTHLRHGGRVSSAAAAAGTALQIKPILHVTEDGRLVNTEKNRGRKKAMEALLVKLEAGWDPEIGAGVMIIHSDCLERAKELKNAVEEHFSNAQVEIGDLSPILGAHSGPDLLALIYWGDNR